MHVFITGGSGHIGSRVIPLLIAHGHTVTALARSESSAKKLESLGAEPIHGELSDVALLEDQARSVDAVLHLAFHHELLQGPNADFTAPGKKDRAALEAFARGLGGKGSEKIIITTSGVHFRTPGRQVTEDDVEPLAFRPDHVQFLRDQGMTAFAVRMSPITHADGTGGFLPMYVDAVKKLGYAPFIEDGQSRFAACHADDAADIYVKVLENAAKLDNLFYHAVGEEAVTNKEFAETTAKKLGLETKSISQEEAGRLLGFTAHMFGADCPASSKITQRELAWKPTGQTLAENIAQHVE
ncbi:oxidoreductase [Kockovaella imperatae]|uniref:Oxidoreductase n=1 Tax=Kockovaella imperatae TaxID=4999 RepID=A0A1Y1UQS7_9TREE|nr:oxidoreductase [Kockovaella imperatae]ORX39796.1 oxidoreductase [Kockovaella imperatae]